MQLPNRNNAFIQPSKLTGYLLSEIHPVGRSKAKFFRDLGFNDVNVLQLESELLKIARFCEVTEVMTNQHGNKYVIIGSIDTPCGKSVTVLTVWIIDAGKENPRFVTARPFLESKG